MIPQQLTLKNFLSYRDTNLDFRGLHTACICGANGAGKSSLLEAIAWSVWGQCRAATEDDAIHAGANSVRVDFEFVCNYQTYRVIRSRTRGKSTSLEFQIKTDSGKYRSLTAKGLRATQQKVIDQLKLDYDTFINSAYLRQGRADEFMLRRPSERKKILADLLKLDRYEELASRAKDISKQYQGQVSGLQSSLQPLEEQIAEKENIATERKQLKGELKKLQDLQDKDKERLVGLQAIEHQRQTWENQLTFQQTQYQNLTRDCDRLQVERSTFVAQITELEKLLAKEAEITAGYRNLLELQKEEEVLTAKFKADRDAREERQQLKQELEREINKINKDIDRNKTRLEGLEQREREIQQIIDNAKDVRGSLEKLERARQKLKELDRLQHEVSPLLQRRNQLFTEISTAKAVLKTTLEQLNVTRSSLVAEMEKVPRARQNLIAVDTKIGELDRKKVRQNHVEEVGKEKKEWRVKLQENQRHYEEEIEKLRQKLALLQTPDAACPLCERELDETYRQRVISKTENEQQNIENQIWEISEELVKGEQELAKLREEYQQLKRELANYESLQQELFKLENQLDSSYETSDRIESLEAEIAQIERSLSSENYAPELQLELKQITQQIESLNYSEENHALVRGEEKSLRWAEFKQAEIERAKKEKAAIEVKKPELEANIINLKEAIARLKENSPLQQQLQQLEEQISNLQYDRSHHDRVGAALRQAGNWQFKEQELKQAREQYPLKKEELKQLEARLMTRDRDKQEMQKQLDILRAEMTKVADNRSEINSLEREIYSRQQQLYDLTARGGKLEQQLKQIENLEIQHKDSQEKLKELRKQTRVYQELTSAFGKNGIQTLMIENILPQLEAETNQILARLTGNQFHVQFLTQKATKSGSKKKQATAKLIDTLDILIADTKGTRPYETYSGGEAFRINFSIRLALAKMLAQRAGTALQMLIIDEGFGTQDTEGCDRLIAAINAIAADFSCILTVTHMQQFKEAFQTRIEVYKTPEGSQLKLSN